MIKIRTQNVLTFAVCRQAAPQGDGKTESLPGAQDTVAKVTPEHGFLPFLESWLAAHPKSQVVSTS